MGGPEVPGAGLRGRDRVTEERKGALLAYCRIEAGELTPEEEVLLDGLYGYAVGYLEQAGVAEPEAGTPRRAQYDLCVNALVLDAWDRRGTAVSERGTFTAAENLSFRRLLNQLKLTEHLTAPLAEAGSAGPRLTEPNVSNLDTSPGEGGGR